MKQPQGYTFKAWTQGYYYKEMACNVDIENNITKQRTICELVLKPVGEVSFKVEETNLDDTYNVIINEKGIFNRYYFCEAHKGSQITRLEFLQSLDEVNVPEIFKYDFDKCYSIQGYENLEFKIIHSEYQDNDDEIYFAMFDQVKIIDSDSNIIDVILKEDYDYGFINQNQTLVIS